MTAKLSTKTTYDIKSILNTCAYSGDVLSRVFNVSPATAYRIRNNPNLNDCLGVLPPTQFTANEATNEKAGLIHRRPMPGEYRCADNRAWATIMLVIARSTRAVEATIARKAGVAVPDLVPFLQRLARANYIKVDPATKAWVLCARGRAVVAARMLSEAHMRYTHDQSKISAENLGGGITSPTAQPPLPPEFEGPETPPPTPTVVEDRVAVTFSPEFISGALQAMARERFPDAIGCYVEHDEDGTYVMRVPPAEPLKASEVWERISKD